MAKPSSKGAALQLSIASVFTTIAQMRSFNGPDAEVQTFDGTALDSGVGMEHYPTGYVEGGNVNGSLFFDPVAATLQALTDLKTAPAISLWKEKWSDTALTEWPFSGILTRVNPKAEVNQGLMADINVKLTGIPTYPT